MTLAHSASGAGPPLVLLHAFPLSSAMWKEAVVRFSGRARVIAPDLPGFGGSAPMKEPSIAGMAEGVAGVLDDLGVREPVFLGGLSMGGYVVFEFLRRFPERVRGLGLFSTRAAADTPEGRQKRMKAIAAIESNGMEPFFKATLPNLVGQTTLQARPETVSEVMLMMRAARPRSVTDALRAMAARRDSTDLLEKISCPALVVAGEEDRFIRLEESKGMAQQIPGARFEVIPRAGHLANLEDPGAFYGALERFWETARLIPG